MVDKIKNEISIKNINYAFFGSSDFSIGVLDQLEKADLLPKIIITTPDMPAGRKLILTPTPVKIWAEKRKIPFYCPPKLKPFANELNEICKEKNINLFAVASYGKIIPREILDIPEKKTLNVHPSLLPKHRGASPLQFSILEDDKDTGVTIMRIDEEMDHGPIVAVANVHMDEWPSLRELKDMMAEIGGKLLSSVIPEWLKGEMKEIEQDHGLATYTRKIEKEDGLIDLESKDQYLNFRKIQAYSGWPSTYFFKEIGGKKIRIKITKARFENGNLIIERVIPEGKKEIDYRDLK